MEIDCQPEEPIVSSFDEDCVELGDVKDMRLEAEAVVNDVLFAVTEMYVSQSLNSALDVAYINVETREGNRYCLELTEAGLRVRWWFLVLFLILALLRPKIIQTLTITQSLLNRWWAMLLIKWMRI